MPWGKLISMNKKIIILGAGPAGLGAGLELIKNGTKPLILEKESIVGGISRTINYKGYRFDIGGHRFFTKSKEISELWQKTLLPEEFLKRKRLSKIYYRNRLFFYPLKPLNALFNLGFINSLLVILSYFKAKIFPKKPENTFDRWVINRFGKKLFNILFKTYTEKLWGIPCQEIEAKWAAQRIKGLSLATAVKNAFFPQGGGKIKTLINEFYYPKYGPGMMYERMARNIEMSNGQVLLNQEVVNIYHQKNKILNIEAKNRDKISAYEGDYFISSLPLTELIKKLKPAAPFDILKAAKSLKFRSLLTINLILEIAGDLFPDNWIYIHSPEVKIGRIQNYKNWSPYLTPKNGNYTSLGLEYFCDENDEFWNRKDEELIALAIKELEIIKIVKNFQFQDGFVVRIPKAYPIYAFDYQKHLSVIKSYLSNFKNLQTMGRGGCFQYNNMDHSILSGIAAAKNILGADYNLWNINIDEEYQEEIVHQ